MRRFGTIAGLFSLALTGCVTTDDLSAGKPTASWNFASDLETTSTCLQRAMNAELQPKTGAEQFWGRSISHSIETASPGVNRIVHEHIGPSTAYTITVRSTGPKASTADAFIAPTVVGSTFATAIASAAGRCSGTPMA